MTGGSHRGDPARTGVEETRAPLWLHSLGEEIGDDHAIIRQQRDLEVRGSRESPAPIPFR
jgi:hypothetical protein